ncbi:predicted protein [Meyerozyma guilliermondii ATCC 6260]|uniref:Uncharacterized protein n=1 Tax=Meyerozyma guilliermondii (strain ATCC 6260 / CBS 566 / DSM 6381 / JCM 1539 / NBRC 10279 / NRRL Y-324) TaxID=294746 RepID=A5DIZ0_PICGU|nr:uncharacterized protein PGUG_03241 [Meyerozyma guilliermondii ATCC 6260]EDK39143.2 predicted protein [Meyerozyma guilliermondii ATCC 6260]
MVLFLNIGKFFEKRKKSARVFGIVGMSSMIHRIKKKPKHVQQLYGIIQVLELVYEIESVKERKNKVSLIGWFINISKVIANNFWCLCLHVFVHSAYLQRERHRVMVAVIILQLYLSFRRNLDYIVSTTFPGAMGAEIDKRHNLSHSSHPVPT